MKHLSRIFESSDDNLRYLEDCFLDISENSNFEVYDILHTPRYTYDIYKIHIEISESITLPRPSSSNLYIGMVETSLNFLKMKNEKLSELYGDIEVAIERIKDKFDYKCDIKIESNRREEINIIIVIQKIK